MTPVLVSVDKAGDLKLGRKKCRLHKKADVVKVAKKYGIVPPTLKNSQLKSCVVALRDVPRMPTGGDATPPCCRTGGVRTDS